MDEERRDELMAAIRKQVGGEIASDSKLSGLGCDSLDLVELIMEAEAVLDVSLDEHLFSLEMTVAEFVSRALAH